MTCRSLKTQRTQRKTKIQVQNPRLRFSFAGFRLRPWGVADGYALTSRTPPGQVAALREAALQRFRAKARMSQARSGKNSSELRVQSPEGRTDGGMLGDGLSLRGVPRPTCPAVASAKGDSNLKGQIPGSLRTGSARDDKA